MREGHSSGNKCYNVISVTFFYYLSYVPSGYDYESHTIVGDGLIIDYANEKGDIIAFDQNNGTINYQLDTEDAELHEVAINGYGGQLVVKEHQAMLFWRVEQTSFLIVGNVSEQEIIRIAENLRRKK